LEVFGENKELHCEGLEDRLRDCAAYMMSIAELRGFSHWEAMATCGTLYVNYLRDSQHRDMAIRDAEELVRALQNAPVGKGTCYGSYKQ
jgi:hypothetical protein